MQAFAEWLRDTPPSITIQTTEWMLPIIQSIHILSIAVIFSSALVVALRIFGLAAKSQTLEATVARFNPWIWGALVVLLLTGLLMITAEPVRELMSPTFWAKMALVLIAGGITLQLHRRIRTAQPAGQASLATGGTLRLAAAGTMLIWVAVIFLGRWIAYGPSWATY